MKAYTDLEQSKKLAEILPKESADMFFRNDGSVKLMWEHLKDIPISTPCWSLAALLNVLPKGEYKDTDLCYGGYQGDKYISEWFCSYGQQEPFVFETCHADNPIDACYEMISKLREKELIKFF